MKKTMFVTAALLLAALMTGSAAYAEAPSLEPGETVFFGSFEQDGIVENGPEPIEWIVLDVRDGAAYLLSRYELAFMEYDDGEFNMSEGVDWEHCSLRAWLNGDFLNSAFGEDEPAAIRLTTIENADNPNYGTRGGADTGDHVFLPSIEEITRYFPEPEDRVALPTMQAIIDALRWNDESNDRFTLTLRVDRADDIPVLHVTELSEDGETMELEYSFDLSGERMIAVLLRDGEAADHMETTGASYFLRSPGRYVWQVAYVKDSGEVEDAMESMAYGMDGIRPALWVDPTAIGLS